MRRSPWPSGHGAFRKLWVRFREAAGDRCIDDATEIVEQTILELHDLDPRGDAFRYATSPEGATNLPTVDSLSFQRAGAAFSAVANYFDAAAMMFSVELEALSDQLVEAHSFFV